MRGRSYKLFIICLCCLASTIAVVGALIHGAEQENQIEIISFEASKEATSTVEPEPEWYQEEGTIVKIYFTNTQEMDEQNWLPIEAQSDLVVKTQEFLEDEGITSKEVRVMEGSLSKEGDHTQFQCEVENYKMTVNYLIDTNEFTFQIER